MYWFSTRFRFFEFISERTGSVVSKFVALQLAALCFKCGHLLFKVVYALNQRELRLLCREDFFLKFYDRRVPNGGVANILKSLRHVERGLKGTSASYSLAYHET